MTRRLGTAVAAVAIVLLGGCGGSHHASLRPQTAPPSTRLAAPAPTEWPTYHGDLRRDGATASGPAPARTQLLWAVGIDGAAYAQPLLASGVVVVATENDSVYAFDTLGRPRWHARLGTPVPGGDLPCGDIDPSGITGTPVIDTRAGTVYVVTFERPGHHTLVALDLATGRVRWRRPIDPPGADPRVEQQRAALALAGGRVYVAYGGLYGDCGDYNGWIVSASATDPRAQLLSYRVPAAREAGIWAPSGPAIDGSGSLYVSTGNGVASSFDFGNAVIRLSPTLVRTDYFAPPNAAQLNGNDGDLGAVGPTLLPGERLLAIGKDGVLYAVSTRHLGGVGGQLASRQVCGGAGAFGGLAYAGGLAYVPCATRLVAVTAADLAPRWQGPGFTPGAPIVAGGYVWSVATDQGELYAFDARDGRVVLREPIGDAAHFATPASDGRWIYVAAGQRLLAFGQP